jgi:hypothetical protein
MATSQQTDDDTLCCYDPCDCEDKGQQQQRESDSEHQGYRQQQVCVTQVILSAFQIQPILKPNQYRSYLNISNITPGSAGTTGVQAMVVPSNLSDNSNGPFGTIQTLASGQSLGNQSELPIRLMQCGWIHQDVIGTGALLTVTEIIGPKLCESECTPNVSKTGDSDS